MKTLNTIQKLLLAVLIFLAAITSGILLQKPNTEDNITIAWVLALCLMAAPVLAVLLAAHIKQQEAARAAVEKERMRANLLKAISHDLRTPLTTIYSASSTLREKRSVLTEAQQDKMLRSIQEDSEWLIRMVENLLSVTRIDSGKVKITKTSTILDELIDSVMTKFLARHPGQSVQLDIPEEIVVIPVDTVLIEQVLLNLLENAVFHAKGMTELYLRVFTLADRAIFEVADNGCGIKDDKLKQLFMGAMADETAIPDNKKRNAGIGLSVCAAIIKAHGGEITAENRKGGGALFRFTLAREELTDVE